ncbi:MAG TPA: PH domain-containing protein [Candidatus Dormibacteraeota bacterium]|nr:PH domain-containing protein [Candidatus Dormibacteraeota bacterium]
MAGSAQLRGISPRFWQARQAGLALLALPCLAAAILGAVAIGGAGGAALVVAVVAVLGVAWSIERGRYRSWGYAEREDDLVVARGLLFRRVTVVPYGRMQLIDVTAGPMARFFDIATVQLHTAAAATDARIPGLLRVDADRLRDRLAAIGEARATGL